MVIENLQFRKAAKADIKSIWKIIQQAIERRKLDGSSQWQDGYPNPETIGQDIENAHGYVLSAGENIIAYCAVLFNNEPAYDHIKGEWLTNGDFLVLHRLAVSIEVAGQGIATGLFKLLEDHAVANNIFSIKVDTNFDNVPMLKILEKLGYTYCGEVYFRGSARKAFEKVLKPG